MLTYEFIKAHFIKEKDFIALNDMFRSYRSVTWQIRSQTLSLIQTRTYELRGFHGRGREARDLIPESIIKRD